MASNLFSLYILIVTGLAVVQAGTSASQCPIRPIHWFVDVIRGIAPLILDNRGGGGYGSVGQKPNGGSLGQAPNAKQNIIPK
jgi:hypothetical protein